MKAKVNLATKEVYKNEKGEKVEETNWHHIVAWGKQAEAMGKFAKKGSEVAILGRLTTRKYEDKEGVSREIAEVTVNEFLLLDKKQSS
jgi:single-strand DNA-binding protein